MRSPLVLQAVLARARSRRAPPRGPAFTADASSNAARAFTREQPRERGLAGAGRPVQDHRVRLALLDRGAQRRARGRAGAPGRRTRRATRGRIRAASGWPAAIPAVRPRGRLLSLEQLLFHSVESRKEARQRLRAFPRCVLPHEVARPVDHHQLRVGQLPLEAMGAGHGRERVVLAPHEQSRHAESTPGRSARASRSRPTGTCSSWPLAALLVRVGLPVLVERLVRSSLGDSDRSIWPKPSRSSDSSACSPTPGSRSPLAIPCHFPSGKKPCRADHERVDRVRVLARPPQPDQPAPVVHHRHAPLDPELAPEALDATRRAAPRCRAGRAASRRSRPGRAPRRASPRPRPRASRRPTCTTTRG